ncbi:hypothetical protein [uncultured Clostridium sp.]|uniref:hypothetical protein n=1 Tax=uncultured Clostridium sp. TaxID=59620 RepID=UPI0026247488|nr:hypothetical protein [uncultured Clostridium sp.]
MSGFKKFKSNIPLINEGFAFLFGVCNNILVRDANKNIICSFYNSEDGEQLIKKYLKEQNIDYFKCSFEEIKKATDENQQQLLDDYRLTYLNKKLVLYKDISNLSLDAHLDKVDHIHKNKYAIHIYFTK